MKFFGEIFKFYIEASLHVALAVACVTGVTFLKFKMEFDFRLCAVSFLATVVSYNFMKYGTKAKSYFMVSSAYLKSIQAVSFFSFALMVYFIWTLKLKVLIVLGISGVLSALYALPLLPGNHSFRSLHGFKIYMVAFCWALITVIIPVVDDTLSFTKNVWIECIQRFVIVLALIIPFDIRDLKDDSLSLGTLPQRLGISRAKRVGYGLVLVFWVCGLFKEDIKWNDIVINSVITLLVFFGIYYAKENQPAYYCGFWVESIPIGWFLFYLLL